MSPDEQKLVAGHAHYFRERAQDSDDPEDRERRELVAKSMERHLSRELKREYRRGLSRPSEDRPLELTREQRQTMSDLATDYDEVTPGRFLPDGAVLAECWNWSESDGSPELAAVVQVNPSGVCF